MYGAIAFYRYLDSPDFNRFGFWLVDGGKSGLLAGWMPYKVILSKIRDHANKGGVSPWKVPQKIYRPGFLTSGKGENVW